MSMSSPGKVATGVRRRVIEGMAAHAIGHVLDICTQVALVPLFLSAWGASEYGDWIALTSFTTFFTLGTIGFATATATEMTIAFANVQEDRHHQIFRTGISLMAVVSVGLTLLVLVATELVDVKRLMRVTTMSPFQCKIITWLFFLRFIEYQCRSFLAAAFHSILKFSRGRMWFNGSSLAAFLATAAALTLGGGPIAVASAGLASLLLVLAAMAIDVRIHIPALSLVPSFAGTLSAHNELLVPSLAAAAVPTSLAIRQHAAVLTTQLMLGPAAVTVLSVTRLLTSAIVQLTRLPQHGALAEMSAAFGKGNLALVRRLSTALIGSALACGGVLAATVIVAGMPVTSWWTSNRVVPDFWLLTSLSVSAVLQSTWNASLVTLLARNLQGNVAVALLITAAVSIPVGIGLVTLIGLPGIGLALASADAVVAALITPLALRLSNLGELPSRSDLLVASE
jgi:O-antigen/teichoic acid export membrane protein